MFDARDQSPPRSEEGATRQKLLDAAGEVFANRGYEDSTVREICAAAGVNIAAVNYHFGDKAGLYKAVLRFADRCAAARAANSAQADSLPEERLRQFVRGYIACLSETGRPGWHTRLIAREMSEPSPVLDHIVDENIRPRSRVLTEIVQALLGAPSEDDRVIRCKLSIIGQCLIYHTGRPVISRLHPGLPMDGPDLAKITDHIVEFTLQAIAGMRKHYVRCESEGRP